MTVVFKSDIKAETSANISNFVGYTGPSDHYIYADISNGVYKKGGVSVGLTNILTSSAQKLFPTIIDKLGNVADSSAGIPRRSFVPAHGVFAVMAETPNAGYVSSSNLIITTKTSTVYAAYATKGRLLIDINSVNLISGTGTSIDPYIFKYKALTTIPFSLDRIDSLAVCTVCVGNRVPLNIVKNRDNVADSDILLNLDGINKNQFTVVFRTVSPKLGNVLGPASGYVPLVKLIEDVNKSVSYVKVRNTSINIQTRNNGIVQGEAQEAALVTQVVDTYAMCFDNGTITHYMNGARINAPSRIQLPSFTLNELKLLSTDSQWSVPKYSDALVNLIVYNRALSASELAMCLFK